MASPEAEHEIEYLNLGQPWGADKAILQARCDCGWETERKEADPQAVEAAAHRHLVSAGAVEQ